MFCSYSVLVQLCCGVCVCVCVCVVCSPLLPSSCDHPLSCAQSVGLTVLPCFSSRPNELEPMAAPSNRSTSSTPSTGKPLESPVCVTLSLRVFSRTALTTSCWSVRACRFDFCRYGRRSPCARRLRPRSHVRCETACAYVYACVPMYTCVCLCNRVCVCVCVHARTTRHRSKEGENQTRALTVKAKPK
jgi:hypothetical protein